MSKEDDLIKAYEDTVVKKQTERINSATPKEFTAKELSEAMENLVEEITHKMNIILNKYNKKYNRKL